MKLANLKQVPLREVWKHEALEFTKWLAKNENLSLLSDEIGIEISLVRTEASVGKFNVDILAEEENTGRKIIIENQLESTDHDHLGKIITYASGFDASIIIWIVKDIRDEHKQAIDWLNEHTDEHANFFAVKMEVWQIGDSPYAPKFQVVSQPNDWAKAVKQSHSKNELTEIKIMQLDFWTEFRKYGKENNSKLRFRKPFPQHWYDISVGDARAQLSLVTDTRNSKIRCEFYIPDNKELYTKLESYQTDIESMLDCKLEWMYLEGKKASRIKTTISADISKTEKWEEYFSWLLTTSENFQKVFLSFLRKID
ncbi:MAG: DUF4268 domain-containing protein [Chloroflexi bacterium]|nr:DUF4268 domain-containing protein [Chloroflexota bacterium]